MRRNRFLNLSFIFVLLFFLSFFASDSAERIRDNKDEVLISTVRFDANGGAIKWYSKEVKLGTIYGSFPVARRNVYKFLGWYRKNTKISVDTVLYDGRDHVLTAKWLGTPSLDVKQEEDFVQIKCGRLGNASGVYLYVNETRYDSAAKGVMSGDVKWSVKKKDDVYTFTANLPEADRYSCYARAYYKEDGAIIESSKSEYVTFDNRDTTYMELAADALLEDHSIPMSTYYSAGKDKVNRWATETLTPQGICYTDKYILLTGYAPKRAKVTVLDRKTKKALAVFGLDEKLLELDLGGDELLGHVGGIAYDEQKKAIWVSGISKKNIIKIHLWTIDKYVKQATRMSNVFELKKDKDFEIYKTAYMDWDGSAKHATPSFLEYEDGYLYIGTFHQNKCGQLRKFKVCAKSCLELMEEMKIPNKIQGAVFTGEGELILSQSYGRENESRLYIYKGEEKELSTYQLDRVIKNLPPMSEELMVQDDRLYILYESSARRYRKTCDDVQEMIWAVDMQKLNPEEQNDLLLLK